MFRMNHGIGFSFWGFLSSITVIIICLGVGYYVWVRIVVTKSLERADRIELEQVLKRWNEAGQPEAEALKHFMRGRRQDLVVSNSVFNINGVDYRTQFAITKPKSQQRGVLFVTTNKVLIWLNPINRPELVRSM